jgi:penicillin-binding protein 2
MTQIAGFFLKEFLKMYKNRLAAFLVVFLLFFIVLTGRLACMQIVHREYYEGEVERKRRRVQIYSGPRGTIFDREGEVLATDRQVFDASFILPLLDPLAVVKPLMCQAMRLSEDEFDKRLEQARLAAVAEKRTVQTLVQKASSRAVKRLRYLSGKYPEKYGALIVRENRVNGYTAYSLDIDLTELCRKERTLREVTAFLEMPFEEAVDKVNSIERKIAGISNAYQRRYELYTPYPLARNITREQVEELEVRYRNYPGIVITARTRRVHPHGDLACHILGYLRQLNDNEYNQLKAQGRTIMRGFNELQDFEKIGANPFFIDDMLGATGIERVYDKYLQGRKGARLLERDTRAPESRALSEIPPEPGANLYLTIDAGVQRAAQDGLAEAGIAGAAVVMDVRSGEIVALASSPGYELDTFRENQDTFKKHLEKPYPLLNRALSAIAPGSGFKLVTAIAALEEGAITNRTHIYCRGYYKTPNAFRCWKRTGHGSIHLEMAIEGSCNVFFYNTGERLGQEKLRKWARILGFGRKTGIDLPGDSEGLIPSPDWKKSRLYASRSRLQRLEVEHENFIEVIKDIRRLSEKEHSQDNTAQEDLNLREERARQLKKDITRERKKLALYENEKAWLKGDTRNMAIGQGNVLATPLQMTRMVAAIANGGRLLRPHLTRKRGVSYVERSLPVSPAVLAIVRKGMHQVVFGRRGTARQEGLKKHNAAAKTGTAEIGGGLNNGWIIGFAPYDNPRIAFVVVAERTKLHGGDVAGPVAAEILDAYFNKDKDEKRKK